MEAPEWLRKAYPNRGKAKKSQKIDKKRIFFMSHGGEWRSLCRCALRVRGGAGLDLEATELGAERF